VVARILRKPKRCRGTSSHGFAFQPNFDRAADRRTSRGTTGALFGGDGFDDEFAGLAGVDGFGGELEGLGDEVLNGWCVEEGGCFEDDVSGHVAAAGEEAFGVAKAGAVLQEEEADPAGIEGDGEDGVGGAVGGGEADGEGVVVVVDELDGAGEAGAHFAEGGAGLGGDFGREFVEEGVQLGGGGFFRGGVLVWGRLLLRGCGLARRHGGNSSTGGIAEVKLESNRRSFACASSGVSVRRSPLVRETSKG
jgi:hypothetical protein